MIRVFSTGYYVQVQNFRPGRCSRERSTPWSVFLSRFSFSVHNSIVNKTSPHKLAPMQVFPKKHAVVGVLSLSKYLNRPHDWSGVYFKLVPFTMDIRNPGVGLLFQFFAQAGDKNIKAPGYNNSLVFPHFFL